MPLGSADARIAGTGRAARLVCWGVACLLAVSALAVLGTMLPVYWVYLLSTVAISALIARSIGVVTGQAGIITLCQMSFAAMGGWTASWLSLNWPTLPFVFAVVIGGVVTAPVGLALGAITMRIRGVELAVVTLGFAAAIDLVLRQGGFPGVGTGTPVIPEPPFSDPRAFYGLVWAFLLVLQLMVFWLGRTRFGLGWSALRVSERSAAALGVRVGAAKASAFGVGALLAGTAGGLLAGHYGLLTTTVFSPLTSLVHLATAVLCGAGLFGGALLAGIFAVGMPEVLRRIGVPLDVGNALLALGAFEVLRRGTGGIAEQLQMKWNDRIFRAARTACTLVPADPDPCPESDPDPVPDLDPDLAMHRAPRLEVSQLSMSYGTNVVLDRIDLSVLPGEVHALIGSNGAGKTTFVDAVTGFLPSAKGAVKLDATSLDGTSARERAERGVRRTFQQGRAIDVLTVGEYLRLSAGQRNQERIRAVSAFFGLPHARLPVRLMDVGSRRILEMAAALAAAPRVLLLDEPGAGLADEESGALAMLVNRIPETFDCGVLLIEHDMSFVRAAADRVTVFDHGRVIATGAVEATLTNPRVVTAYLGETVSA